MVAGWLLWGCSWATLAWASPGHGHHSQVGQGPTALHQDHLPPGQSCWGSQGSGLGLGLTQLMDKALCPVIFLF